MCVRVCLSAYLSARIGTRNGYLIGTEYGTICLSVYLSVYVCVYLSFTQVLPLKSFIVTVINRTLGLNSTRAPCLNKSDPDPDLPLTLGFDPTF